MLDANQKMFCIGPSLRRKPTHPSPPPKGTGEFEEGLVYKEGRAGRQRREKSKGKVKRRQQPSRKPWPGPLPSPGTAGRNSGKAGPAREGAGGQSTPSHSTPVGTQLRQTQRETGGHRGKLKSSDLGPCGGEQRTQGSRAGWGSKQRHPAPAPS